MESEAHRPTEEANHTPTDHDNKRKHAYTLDMPSLSLHKHAYLVDVESTSCFAWW